MDPPQEATDIFSLSDQALSDRLQFIEEIGFGNWGSVWLCRPRNPEAHALDAPRESKIAVKLVHRSKTPTTAARVRSLWNEMKIVRTFKTDPHPSIIPFHSFIITPSYALITMEFLPTLIPVEVSETTARVWFRALLSAVAFLHARGVVHNDIKPANILLSPKNVPVLVDFGFAEKYDRQTAKAFRSDLSYGTPEYLAPERARGLPHDTRKSDVWSLGITFFEILVGRTPFEHSDTEQFSTKADLERYWARTMRGTWVGRWSMSRGLENLLRAMIAPNADLRCTASLAMADAYWSPPSATAAPALNAHRRASSYASGLSFDTSVTKLAELISPWNRSKDRDAGTITPPGLDVPTPKHSYVRPTSSAAVLPTIEASPAASAKAKVIALNTGTRAHRRPLGEAKENLPPAPQVKNAKDKDRRVRPLADLAPRNGKTNTSTRGKENAPARNKENATRGKENAPVRDKENEGAPKREHADAGIKAAQRDRVRERVREWERERERLREMERLEEREREREEELAASQACNRESREFDLPAPPTPSPSIPSPSTPALFTSLTSTPALLNPSTSTPALLTPTASTPTATSANTSRSELSASATDHTPVAAREHNANPPRSPVPVGDRSTDSALRGLGHSLRKSIDLTMRLYKSSSLARGSHARTVSAQLNTRESWENIAPEPAQPDNRPDRMALWMQTVEQVVADARETFAAAPDPTPQVLSLAPVPLSRAASATHGSRSARFPRRMLAANQIFRDDASSPGDSIILSTSSAGATANTTIDTNTTNDITADITATDSTANATAGTSVNITTISTAPSAALAARVLGATNPLLETPTRQRRATVSTRSPEPGAAASTFDDLQTGSPSKRKEKARSHNNLLQHITPVSLLAQELEQAPAPLPSPRLSAVIDRSLFIAPPTARTDVAVPMITLAAPHSQEFDELTASPQHVEPYPQRTYPPAPDTPSLRRLEGVYDRFLMATSGVARLGRGYQSQNFAPVSSTPDAAPSRNRGFHSTRRRMAMPPPVSSDDQRRTVSVDELGVMTPASGPGLTSPGCKDDGHTTVAIVRRAFKAMVTGKPVSRRLSRAA